MKEIEALWREVRELSLGNNGRIERLESPPTPLQFLRDFINPNKPCIISNSINHWTALSSWPHYSYLSQSLSSASVSLHLTPTGRADALTATPSSSSSASLCFASAHVERVPFPEALRLISSEHEHPRLVAYAQQQNDCFRTEYSALAKDCDPHIAWATEALGAVPEAVNLWIGNQHSQTCFHKDHYENLYAVVTGENHFLLLPLGKSISCCCHHLMFIACTFVTTLLPLIHTLGILGSLIWNLRSQQGMCLGAVWSLILLQRPRMMRCPSSLCTSMALSRFSVP